MHCGKKERKKGGKKRRVEKRVDGGGERLLSLEPSFAGLERTSFHEARFLSREVEVERIASSSLVEDRFLLVFGYSFNILLLIHRIDKIKFAEFKRDFRTK